MHDSGSTSPRILNFPLDKDYFSKKIKKTVKNYFQIRRTSMGNNFNLVELLRENRKIEGVKSELKNHKVNLELDASCAKTDTNKWGKGLSSKVLAKVAVEETVFDRVSIEKTAVIDEKKNNEVAVKEELAKVEFKCDKFHDGLTVIKEKTRKYHRRLTGRSGCFVKVDMGLQTEDFGSSESHTRKLQTKFSMYEGKDDMSDC